MTQKDDDLKIDNESPEPVAEEMDECRFTEEQLDEHAKEFAIEHWCKIVKSNKANIADRTTDTENLIKTPGIAGATLEDIFPILKIENLGKMTEYILYCELILLLHAPLYSLDRLAELLQLAVKYLEQNKQQMIQTGYPLVSFADSPWIEAKVANLYCMKNPTSVRLAKNGLRISNGVIIGGCNNFDYFYDPSMIIIKPEDAMRIEHLRPKLFELKVAVINELREAITFHDGNGVWDKCLAIITGVINSDERAFLSRIDLLYARFGIETPRLEHYYYNGLNGGRITDLLHLIGHVEEELKVGYHQKLYHLICSLVQPFDDIETIKHLLIDKGNEVGTIKKILSNSDLLGIKVQKFWNDFDTRLAKAIKEEFKASGTVEILAKKKDLAMILSRIKEWSEQLIRNTENLSTIIDDSNSNARITLDFVPTGINDEEFIVITAGGKSFKFLSETEMNLAKLLFNSYINNTPRVKNSVIMEKIYGSIPRSHVPLGCLQDEIKNQDYWKEGLISNNPPGYYQLSENPVPPKKSKDKRPYHRASDDDTTL